MSSNGTTKISRSSQAEKFAALAREVEADEDEQKFDEALRRVSAAKSERTERPDLDK